MGDNGKRKMGMGGGVLMKSSQIKWTKQELPANWPPLYTNAPPLYSDDVGEVDTSNARFVVVDGNSLKERGDYSYQVLLDFAFQCYQKCALRKFTHPGQNGVPGGLASFEGEKLNEIDFYLQRASLAITQYNRLWKANLKLEKLLKVNFILWAGELYYMTFTAYDEDTGKTGKYQAALKSLRALKSLPNTDAIDGYVLGLFIDCSTDKILACISITGAEEDLAAKKKIIADAKAGVQVRRF